MTLQSYRDLVAWQKAMELVEEMYRLTKLLPKDEIYGLTSQIRRAAVSIPANIAEGYGRLHRKEYLNHLSIARGSLMELETQIELTVRLEYLAREQVRSAWSLAQEVGKLLNSLLRSLGARGPEAPIS